MREQKHRGLVAILFAVFFISPVAVHGDDAANEQLLRAVNLGDIAELKTWLGKGGDPNYTPMERPILSRAAQNGNVEIVATLLAANADVNARDSIGHTALMRAAESDKPAVVEILVKAKANLDVQTTSGENALMLAINSHNPAMVKALVAGGANLNLKTTGGDSAAMAAALANVEQSAEIISILAAGKADLDSGNGSHTPLSYAVQQGNASIVKALLQGGANPNAKAESGSYPLALAFDNSEPNTIVEELLKAKANPNITSVSGKTPLLMAAEKGSLKNVELLIKAGAELNTKDNDGNTALTAATRAAHNEIAELLVKHGAVPG